jgi:hypothetical protein
MDMHYADSFAARRRGLQLTRLCPALFFRSAAQLLREISKVNMSAEKLLNLVKEDPGKVGWLAAGVLGPYFGTQLWWRTCYHKWGTEAGVDTAKFIQWKDAKLAAYYAHRRIPICELYELYIEDKFDWNPECEGGDCYRILEFHRDKFVNYKTTWRQVQALGFRL